MLKDDKEQNKDLKLVEDVQKLLWSEFTTNMLMFWKDT